MTLCVCPSGATPVTKMPFHTLKAGTQKIGGEGIGYNSIATGVDVLRGRGKRFFLGSPGDFTHELTMCSRNRKIGQTILLQDDSGQVYELFPGGQGTERGLQIQRQGAKNPPQSGVWAIGGYDGTTLQLVSKGGKFSIEHLKYEGPTSEPSTIDSFPARLILGNGEVGYINYFMTDRNHFFSVRPSSMLSNGLQLQWQEADVPYTFKDKRHRDFKKLPFDPDNKKLVTNANGDRDLPTLFANTEWGTDLVRVDWKNGTWVKYWDRNFLSDLKTVKNFELIPFD